MGTRDIKRFIRFLHSLVSREKKIKISNKMHIKHMLILALMIGVAHSRSYKAAMLGAEETDECDDCGLGFTCCLNDDGQGHVCCVQCLGRTVHKQSLLKLVKNLVITIVREIHTSEM